jgi:hypothetical protein
MAKIYPTIEEEIQKRPFSVIIPEGYQFQVHPYYLEFNAPPLCDMPSQDMCKSRLPITHIVDMCFKKVKFNFTEPRDIPKIIILLEVYLERIRQYRSVDPDIELFASRCEVALTQLRPVRDRMDTQLRNAGTPRFEPNQLSKLLDKIRRATGGNL